MREGKGLRWIKEVAAKYAGDECLPFPFQRNNEGYGVVSLEGTKRSAAKVTCEITKGKPPSPKHETAHSCGNGASACCTPGHLSWKTHAGNEADKRGHKTNNEGSRNGNARLTSEQVRAIRRSSARGVDLALEYGVNRSRISEIRNRNSWKHLED